MGTICVARLLRQLPVPQLDLAGDQAVLDALVVSVLDVDTAALRRQLVRELHIIVAVVGGAGQQAGARVHEELRAPDPEDVYAAALELPVA